MVSKLIPLLIMVLAMAAAVLVTAGNESLAPSQSRPNCSDRCGNVTVPYPFGIGDGCYLREVFSLSCNETTQTLLYGGIVVTSISSLEGEMQVLSYIASDCYAKNGSGTVTTYSFLWVVPPFTISGTRNKFIAVGYDTYAIFTGYRYNDSSNYVTGCMSVSDSLENANTAAGNEPCSGVGCCTATIPSGLGNHTIDLRSYNNHIYVWSFNPCSYAFIVEEREFIFNPSKNFQQLNESNTLPMILDWEIPDGSCGEVQNRSDYACKEYSECVNGTADINIQPTGYYLKTSSFDGKT